VHRECIGPDQTVGVPLLTLAVATVTLAQGLDLGTFIAMVRQGGLQAEANPFVAQLVGGYGMPMAAIAKVALLAFVIALTVVLAGRRTRIERGAGMLVIGLAILAGIVGGGTNVMTMGGMALAR
jgi:hypothetical protein